MARKRTTKASVVKDTVVKDMKEAAEEVKEVAEKAIDKVTESDGKETTATINKVKETGAKTAAKTASRAKKVRNNVEKAIKEKAAEIKASISYTQEVYVQYQGNESDLETVVQRIKEQYAAEGNKEEIKSLNIYLKPEDASAYYVINGNNSGKVFLF